MRIYSSVKKQTSQKGEPVAESDIISLLPESAFSPFPLPLSFSLDTTLFPFSSLVSHPIARDIYSQHVASELTDFYSVSFRLSLQSLC